jgi:hypothetical protein
MPRAQLHYPGSYAEQRAWFLEDAACLGYLDWLRWPEGFCCLACSVTVDWKMARSAWRSRRLGGPWRNVRSVD